VIFLVGSCGLRLEYHKYRIIKATSFPRTGVKRERFGYPLVNQQFNVQNPNFDHFSKWAPHGFSTAMSTFTPGYHEPSNGGQSLPPAARHLRACGAALSPQRLAGAENFASMLVEGLCQDQGEHIHINNK